MKKHLLLPLLFICALGLRAESAKTYQVTGPIIALTDNVITVEKDKEKWEIARGSAKVDGKLAVGSKVTIYYKMSAEKIDVKDAPAPAADAGKDKKVKK